MRYLFAIALIFTFYSCGSDKSMELQGTWVNGSKGECTALEFLHDGDRMKYKLLTGCDSASFKLYDRGWVHFIADSKHYVNAEGSTVELTSDWKGRFRSDLSPGHIDKYFHRMSEDTIDIFIGNLPTTYWRVK